MIVLKIILSFTPDAIQNLDLKIDPDKNLELSIKFQPFLKWVELLLKYYLTNFIDKLLEVQKHLKESPQIILIKRDGAL